MNEYAYQTETAYDTKRDHNPDAFFNIADQADARMRELVNRISALTDRLVGSAPPSGEASGKGGDLRAIPSGHFEAASQSCASILMGIEQINRLLSRIEAKL
jgi:hypothetical protein